MEDLGMKKAFISSLLVFAMLFSFIGGSGTADAAVKKISTAELKAAEQYYAALLAYEQVDYYQKDAKTLLSYYKSEKKRYNAAKKSSTISKAMKPYITAMDKKVKSYSKKDTKYAAKGKKKVKSIFNSKKLSFKEKEKQLKTHYTNALKQVKGYGQYEAELASIHALLVDVTGYAAGGGKLSKAQIQMMESYYDAKTWKQLTQVLTKDYSKAYKNAEALRKKVKKAYDKSKKKSQAFDATYKYANTLKTAANKTNKANKIGARKYDKENLEKYLSKSPASAKKTYQSRTKAYKKAANNMFGGHFKLMSAYNFYHNLNVNKFY